MKIRRNMKFPQDMEQQHGAFEGMEPFLEDVAEQIQYEPVRAEIKAELAAHIEDRKAEYIDQGLEADKAQEKALEDMGDPVEVGIRLNETRGLQKNHFAVILVMALAAIGIIGNIRLAMVENLGIWLSGFFYFLCGITIFAIMYYTGYQKLVKNIRKVNIIILAAWGVYLGLSLAQRQLGSTFLFRLTSMSIVFAWELLSIPAVIGMVYFNRNKNYKPFLLVTVLTAAMIGITSRLVGGYMLAAHLILIIAVYASLLYMIGKGMLSGKPGRQILAWVLSLGTVMAIFILSFPGNWKYELEQCFYPEKVVSDYWDDAYNSILIKDLLRKALPVGTVSLSQEERMGYYTDEWYFDNLDEFHYRYKMQGQDEASITLEDILPQHYQNNYRITYWVLKYGWLPALVLLGIILTAYGILIRMVGKIKNKMGKILAFSCVLTLILQSVVYFMGNMGYQIGWFCNFPFISEGFCSILTNMILAGLACSAYRYDRVVKEEKKGYMVSRV